MAKVKSDAYSVAAFSLARGHETPMSHNKISAETFLVTDGHGHVVLDGAASAVGPGSVVAIPPGRRHALQADENENIDFFAVEAPAFQPEDYVADPAQKAATN